MRHVFTIGIAVLPLVSVAAPPPIQLSAPPVAVVTESVTANSPSIAVTSGPSARANITPVPSVGGVNLPGVPPVVSRSAPRLEETPRPIAGFDTTPAESAPDPDRPITVKPGTTELVRIARGYLNRIVTPFSDPKLLSVNDLEVKKEGTSLFVATAAEQPVGVYILPNDPNDSRSISLTLIPSRIPPRTIELKWPASAATALSPAIAQRWEEADPYEDRLLDLAQKIANGEVPDGYSLSDMTGPVPCALPEVRFDGGQQLTGSHFNAYVLRVTNQGHSSIELEGHAGCNPPGLALVAPWPHALLEPNTSTELYVVVVNDQEVSRAPALVRPSLLSQPRSGALGEGR